MAKEGSRRVEKKLERPTTSFDFCIVKTSWNKCSTLAHGLVCRLVSSHEENLRAELFRGLSIFRALSTIVRHSLNRNTHSKRVLEMAKILLVEDDPVLAKSVQLNLELESWTVVRAASLAEARNIEAAGPIDGVILDLGLPDGSGLTFLNELREKESRVPVLVLTAQTDEESVVAGLELGANDYIRKPFSMRELMVRIKVALKEPTLREHQVRFGPLLILKEARNASIDSVPIELNRREFDILTYLADHGGQVVTRERLLTKMDVEGEVFDRTIDSHISHIRARLKKAGVTQIVISSVYGVGYRLEEKSN
jgi:two-component system, OmpR family, response regulator